MKAHVKTYLDFFGYDEASFIKCEICQAKAVDIHHIKARGMGGTKERFINQIENLMGLCRDCHIKYGDKTEYMEFLQQIHRKVLLGSLHDNETEIFYDIFGRKKL